MSGKDEDDVAPMALEEDDERSGRSLFREKPRPSTQEKQQLPTPHLTPTMPTDPFPAFEITASTPATNGEDAEGGGSSGRSREATEDAKKGNSEESSMSDASSHMSDGSASSSGISDGPPSPTKPSQSEPIATKARTQSATKKDKEVQDSVRKLSASQMAALTSEPDSLPRAVLPSIIQPQRKPNGSEYPFSAGLAESTSRPTMNEMLESHINGTPTPMSRERDGEPGSASGRNLRPHSISTNVKGTGGMPWSAGAAAGLISGVSVVPEGASITRPQVSSRTLSTPPINRRTSSGIGPSLTSSHAQAARRNSFNPLARPPPLNLNGNSNYSSSFNKTVSMASSSKLDREQSRIDSSPPSPILPNIPLPPMSIPTHLQLELAGQRPSPLYIYASASSDLPYESATVKFERLMNIIWLIPSLEATLTFGALACLDAWLYTFTILPMRFCIAVGVLFKWWGYIFAKETRWVVGFVWNGVGRLWRRGRRGSIAQRGRKDSAWTGTESEAERSVSRSRDYVGPNSTSTSKTTTPGPGVRPSLSEQPLSDTATAKLNGHANANGNFHPPKHAMPSRHSQLGGTFRHRRTKSMPSNLTSFHKADMLQGLVVIFSSIVLMNFDASRMYHFVRAQSAMKLYVIYNVLEVGDRLLGALGQDIFECLFSNETLSRNSSGRSKLLLPFFMFMLALAYNVAHAICLFYQVITLNVAVNSYSNALLTLLVSNQFVEIKGSVFKKFEKENLFQLTCADVVERFQLWVSLLIIGLRNVVEVGGLSVPGAGSEMDGGSGTGAAAGTGPGPLHTASILPASFTALPSWLKSGEVLSPFVIVIASEMIVDFIKHAYINKFNNVKPTIYRRMLDLLCKDYYTNAFVTPSLTRRLGLPVLPLSCLFIRAAVQIYHMFLATHLPPPIPTSTTELSVESANPSSPAMTAALERLDALIRNALGRATYGYGASFEDGTGNHYIWWAPWTWGSLTSDDAIAIVTMLTFFFLAWVVLLIFKLLLGMVLLKYSRRRYADMKVKEHAVAKGEKQPENYTQRGKRIGGWGSVEVGDEKRRWIYDDDPDGLKRMRERERKMEAEMDGKGGKAGGGSGEDKLAGTMRYEMVAKRIW